MGMGFGGTAAAAAAAAALRSRSRQLPGSLFTFPPERPLFSSHKCSEKFRYHIRTFTSQNTAEGGAPRSTQLRAENHG